jgi:hypothetical protein
MTCNHQPLNSPSRQLPPSDRGGYWRWLRPMFALSVIAVVYFYGLDRSFLWGDEADTGIEARNILRSGYPIAYDGRNVSIFENGTQLNRNLVCKKLPWSQYYLGALSLLAFGDNALGLRVLFIFSGILAFFPIYALLKTRQRFPAILTALVLISPQTVLFQRNARYYPLMILLFAILVWHVSRNFKKTSNHFILASLIFILMFHTHPFAAMCSSLSLIAFCLFYRRKILVSYFFACSVGFASWFVWYQLLGPSLAETELFISLIKVDFGRWFKMFCIGLWATVVDMDTVGCPPMLLWLALLVYLIIWRRNALLNLFREPLYAFVFLNVLVQTVAAAALFGYESGAIYSLLRYMPHLLVFGLVSGFWALDTAITNKSLCLFVCLVAVAFNLLTFSFWTKPLSRRVPVSWVFPVYSEIFMPRENIWDVVISRMERESENAARPDSVMISLPAWTQDLAIFYLGKHYLVRPILQEPVAEREQSLRKIMEDQSYDRLFKQPEWILDFLDVTETVPLGYELAAIIPAYQTRPDDGSRPELTRHSFPQSAVVRFVKIFSLQKN